MAPLVLNLGTKWTVNFTLWHLYPRGKRPVYVMKWRLGRLHRQTTFLLMFVRYLVGTSICIAPSPSKNRKLCGKVNMTRGNISHYAGK